MRAEVNFSQNCDCEVRNVEGFDYALPPGVSFSSSNESDDGGAAEDVEDVEVPGVATH